MSSPQTPHLHRSWLELPNGRTFWLAARCAIGRQPDNDLVLDLPALSRRHALIVAEGAGYTLSDLRSRNGTFVNRAAVTRPVVLRDGDEICVGDALLRFRCTRRIEPPAETPDYATTARLDQVRERTCWLLLVDVVGFTHLNDRVGNAPIGSTAAQNVAAPYYVNGGRQVAYMLGLVWSPMDYVRFTAQYAHLNVKGGPRATVNTVAAPGTPNGILPFGTLTPANERKFGVDTAGLRAQIDF